MPIQVLLADDHKMVRDGLRMLITGQPGMAVIGEASNGREAVEQSFRLGPDVVVMDVRMPDIGGIEATMQILRNPVRKPRVIALSMYAEGLYVVQMLKAGASGYVAKDSAFEELAQAIKTVNQGIIYLSPTVTGPMVGQYQKPLSDPSGLSLSRISRRQREVLRLLAEGMTTREIAGLLGLSPKTVECHRTRLMDNLGLYTVAQLTRYAIQIGLIHPD